MNRRAAAALLAVSMGLAACGVLPQNAGLEPQTVITDVPVDTNRFAAMLNAYRSENGLPPVQVDGVLNGVSRDMARHIAERDSMKTWAHSAFGLSQRLEKAGYQNIAAAENLGAGYASLEAAMIGWQGSEGHNRNLLNPYVTRVGIARTNRSDGTWRHFWAMTLARPVSDGRPAPQ
ncbi:MAG: CAP domain-containing protein [Roseibium sp.]|nr:CAP domain-containing protein [Roseibium sp.]